MGLIDSEYLKANGYAVFQYQKDKNGNEGVLPVNIDDIPTIEQTGYVFTSGDPKYFRHYKGGIYRMICEAIHTETGEEEVVYCGSNGKVWVRPEKMFFEKLDDGTERFEQLESIAR